MEIVKEIETSEFLRRWRWYAGALQQHHYATLMLLEVFAKPGMDYEMRAWESLDWVFQVPSCIPHAHRARWVVEGAVGVMKEYRKARKLRCPTLMDERLGITTSSPRTPKLPNSRKIAARPALMSTTAHFSDEGNSRSGQSQVKSQGTISNNHFGTLANTIILDHALSHILETGKMRASLQDTAMDFGAGAMLMNGVKYEDTGHSYPGRVCCLMFLCLTEEH